MGVRVVRSIAVATVLATALAVAGCSGDQADKSDAGAASTTSVALPAAHLAPVDLAALGVDASTQTRCETLATGCLLPWPSDHFTVADSSTPTGRRLAIETASTPANASGVHIDVTDQNRADGFSPGAAMDVQLGPIDAAGLPGLPNLTAKPPADATVVVVDTTSGERVPIWAELDSQADEGQPPLLMVHPARNFADGHRIVVGVRGLKTPDGAPVEPSKAFAAYRDGQRSTDDTFEARRPAMERTFADLAEAGVARTDLIIAWDFTVASTESLTGRIITIRDDAFAQLGDAAPTFTVDKVTDRPDPGILRRVQGSFQMPLYLTDGGAAGGRLVLDDDGKPLRQDGTFTATYTCQIPEAAATGPVRVALYGHGLLGDQGEVEGDLTRGMSQDHGVGYCATDLYGMAEGDIGSAVAALGDLSKFPALPDRLQQGLLAFMFLGRLVKDDSGFVTNAAFQVDRKPAFDTSQLYYDGNSQGAILGGALAAVDPDIDRVALGEAGMNYGLLLDRSVDFDDYLLILKPSYPARVDRVIGLALAQLLWDRGETNGYANHLTSDPLPGTEARTVLLYGAVGDHQVSEYSLRVEAATMAVPALKPIAAAGRVAEHEPGALLKAAEFPTSGSLYVLFDTGSPPSPVGNVAPREGHDPHDDTPNIPELEKLKNQFFRPDGKVDKPCDAPCKAPVPPENAD